MDLFTFAFSATQIHSWKSIIKKTEKETNSHVNKLLAYICLHFYRWFPKWCRMVCWKWKGSPSMPRFMPMCRANSQILAQITWVLPQVRVIVKNTIYYSLILVESIEAVSLRRESQIRKITVHRERKNQLVTDWLLDQSISWAVSRCSNSIYCLLWLQKPIIELLSWVSAFPLVWLSNHSVCIHRVVAIPWYFIHNQILSNFMI